jgi:hypothetical protein
LLAVVTAAILNSRFPRVNTAGKIVGAWLVSLPMIAVVGFSIYAIGLTINLAVGVAVNVGVMIIAFVWVRCVTTPHPLGRCCRIGRIVAAN